jgi:hypothetical protein
VESNGGTGAINVGQRRPLWVMGAALEILIEGEQIGGAYAVAEDRSSPGGRGARRPRHPDPGAEAPPAPDPRRLLEAAPRYGVEFHIDR